MALGETSPEGREFEPLVWDDEIRSKVKSFFPIVAEGLDNSDLAASYAEALKFVFLKGDAQTLKSMRETLLGPFDKAYPKLTYEFPSSPFLFDCLVGLHGTHNGGIRILQRCLGRQPANVPSIG